MGRHVFKVDPPTKNDRGNYVMRIAAASDIGGGRRVIPLKDIDFSLYKKNPTILFVHNKQTFPVGLTHSLTQHDDGAIDAEFSFDSTNFAQEVERSFSGGYLRGSSIRIWIDRKPSGKKYYLREWSLTPLPDDPGATLRSDDDDDANDPENPYIILRSSLTNVPMAKKDPDTKPAKNTDPTPTATPELSEDQMTELTKSVTASMKEELRSMIDTVKKDILEETRSSEDAKGDVMVDYMRYKKLIDDDEIMRSNPTVHDLLVSAVGDNVEDAKEKSEDYLRAIADQMLDRREEVRSQSTFTRGENKQSKLTMPSSARQLRKLKQ